jgi:hypothetical protein
MPVNLRLQQSTQKNTQKCVHQLEKNPFLDISENYFLLKI